MNSPAAFYPQTLLTEDRRYRPPIADKPITVVPYDSEWPSRFDAERALLEPPLGQWLTEGIHHIGSTAVPGLASKPIIDMMAGVRDLEAARMAFDALGELSYIYAPTVQASHITSRNRPCIWRRQHTASISLNRKAISGASGSRFATLSAVTPSSLPSTRR